jgi:hypothetical protein
MRDLRKHEQSAMEAVAKWSSAKWEEGGDPPGAYLRFNGKRVAVGIATLKRRETSHGNAAKPRLRFDKVVVWLMERLQTTLGKTVPHGMTLLLTVTAPIRLPAKTAASLEERIQTLFGRRSPVRNMPSGVANGRDVPARVVPVRDVQTTTHGNRVRIRVLRGGAERAPKMIGFVHNSDTDPLLLFNMTGEMLQLASAEAGRRLPTADLERWLVVISARGISCLAAYRYIYSQLLAATGFKKVVMVFGDGRVGVLAE